MSKTEPNPNLALALGTVAGIVLVLLPEPTTSTAGAALLATLHAPRLVARVFGRDLPGSE